MAPRPSRATVPPGRVGSRQSKSYNSFTLRSPPSQCQPGDLPHSGFGPARPADLIVHRSPSSHRILRLGLALIAVLLLAGVGEQRCVGEDEVVRRPGDRRLVRRRPGRARSTRSTATGRRSPSCHPTSSTTRTPRRRSAARSRSPSRGSPIPVAPIPLRPRRPKRRARPTEDSTNEELDRQSPTDTAPTGRRHDYDRRHETTDTSGPSSVPVPLLVLGGLAVLLLAAGSAGYLRRRMGGDDDGDGTPPASAWRPAPGTLRRRAGSHFSCKLQRKGDPSPLNTVVGTVRPTS